VAVAITTITGLAIAVVTLLITVNGAVSTVLVWLTTLSRLWASVPEFELAGCRTPVARVRVLVVTSLVGVH
jgi:hypothetical protein